MRRFSAHSDKNGYILGAVGGWPLFHFYFSLPMRTVVSSWPLRSWWLLGLFFLAACELAKPGLASESSSQTTTGFIVEEASQANPQLEDYLNFINGSYDGVVHLQQNSFLSLFTDPNTGEHLGGTSVSSNLRAEINTFDQAACFAEVSLGERTLPCDEEWNLSAVPRMSKDEEVARLSGSTQTLQIRYGDALDIETEVYIPASFEAYPPQPVFDQVAEGTTISWAADPNFSHDLILILDYRPNGILSNPDPDFNAQYPQRVSYAKVIPDQGSYTFTTEDLSAFVPGMTVEMFLIRGNYAVYRGEASNLSVAFAAYANLNHYFKVQ